MESEWPLLSVESLTEKVAMGPFGSNIKVSTFVDSGVPVISGEHLHGTRMQDGRFNFITEEHAKKLKNSLVERGDVVFTHAGNIGQAAVIPNTSRYPKYIISQRQFYARCKRDLMMPEYLAYFFHSPDGRHKLLSNASQVGVPSIARPSSHLKSIEVPTPPLSYQQSVVEILEAIETRIDHNRALAANLESIARRLFKSWFVDFDPVRAKVAGEKPAGLADDIAALFPDQFVESELGEIPKEWTCHRVSELCEAIFSGGTPHTQTQEYWGGELPWLSSGETRSRFIVDTEKSVTQAGVDNSSTRLARASDVVIASAGQGSTRGQTSLLALDTYINQSVVALRASKETYSSALLFLDLSSRYDEMRSISDSHSSRGSLTTKLLGSMLSVAPPKPVIVAFDALVSPLIGRIVVAECENSRLGTIRDLLLPRLISGKLRVADAESLIEEAIA